MISFRIFVKTKIQTTMKRTTLLLLLVAFAGCLTAYPQKKEAPKRQGWDIEGNDPLYGNVESITITRYELADKFGEIVKGNVADRDVYRFNSKGDATEYCTYGNSGWVMKNLYTYNSQGKMIEKNFISNGSLLMKYLYKYDAQGNMTEEAWYKGDGSLDSKWKYKYDAQGNMTEEAEYNSNGLMSSKTIYKYDSQGNMIEQAEYQSDGSLNYKHLYKYDSQGNWIEKTEYKSEIMIPVIMEERVIVYRQ